SMIFLFRHVLPRSYVAVLVLLVGLNPFFWQFKDQILSDIPFLFFALLSLGLFASTDASDGSARRRAIVGLLSGAAAYAAYATRTLGFTLIPCFVVHDLWRLRRV